MKIFTIAHAAIAACAFLSSCGMSEVRIYSQSEKDNHEKYCNNFFDFPLTKKFFTIDHSKETILFSGRIDRSVINQLQDALIRTGYSTVILRSAGGDSNPSLDFINAVSDFNLNAYVHQYCASSCAIILAAFEEVNLCDDALITMHSASNVHRFLGLYDYFDVMPIEEQERDVRFLSKYYSRNTNVRFQKVLKCTAEFTRINIQPRLRHLIDVDDNRPRNWAPSLSDLVYMGYNIKSSASYSHDAAILAQSQNPYIHDSLREVIAKTARDDCKALN